MPSDMSDDRNIEIMALTGDGIIRLGAPVDIEVDREVDYIPDMPYCAGQTTYSATIKCHPSAQACYDFTKLWNIHNIRQWLNDGNLGYGDYTPRFSGYALRPMQVFPTKVICNPPATIAFWDDGTKTVAKTSDDHYDPYIGLMCCIVKHVGAPALDDSESVNGKLKRILKDAGMCYQAPSKFGKHWFTKEFQRFTVTTPNGKCKEKWIEVAGTES